MSVFCANTEVSKALILLGAPISQADLSSGYRAPGVRAALSAWATFELKRRDKFIAGFLFGCSSASGEIALSALGGGGTVSRVRAAVAGFVGINAVGAKLRRLREVVRMVEVTNAAHA